MASGYYLFSFTSHVSSEGSTCRVRPVMQTAADMATSCMMSALQQRQENADYNLSNRQGITRQENAVLISELCYYYLPTRSNMMAAAHAIKESRSLPHSATTPRPTTQRRMQPHGSHERLRSGTESRSLLAGLLDRGPDAQVDLRRHTVGADLRGRTHKQLLHAQTTVMPLTHLCSNTCFDVRWLAIRGFC